MCYQFFRKESTFFTTKTRCSNEFSQHDWQESFDGDSFVSQSKFDAYAIQYYFLSLETKKQKQKRKFREMIMIIKFH